MRIQLLQENLVRAVACVQKAVPAKPNIPVLAGLHLKAEHDTLTISGTDLYLGIQTSLKVTVEEPGEIVVPGKILSETLAQLSAGSLSLEQKANTLKIVAPDSTISVQLQPSEDYPPFPIEPSQTFTFKVDQLNEVSQYVQFAVSNDVTRPVLTSLLFEFTDEALQVVGTDGFRLAVMGFPAQSGITPQKWLVPVKAIAEVFKIATQEKVTELNVAYSEDLKQLFFKIGEVSLFVRLIDGEYPPYEKIIPSAFNLEVQFDSQELLTHLKRAVIFARESSYIVHLEIKDEAMTLTATSPTSGMHESRVPVTTMVAGEGKIAFNARYLQDFLTAAKGQRLWFGMGDSLKPAMFKIEGLEKYQYIVMPFRVSQ